MTNPANYWRANKKWSSLLGKKGVVIATTYNRVAAPEFLSSVPYSYAIVQFEDQRVELMGVGHEELSIGDEVIGVLRKVGESDKKGLINYGIKVQKL